MMTEPDSDGRRAGDSGTHDAELDALRHEMGMGAVRSPLPVSIDEISHGSQVAHPNPVPGGPSLEELIAHQRPPVPTHLVEGALDEHAHHVKHEEPED